jgi:hypothetical protein
VGLVEQVLALMAVLVACQQLSISQSIKATALPAAGPHILAPARAYSFPATKYVFSVRWQMFKAGTSSVSMERFGSALHVAATADSAGFPDKVFHVHDLFNAEVDPRSFCTLHVSKHNDEGPHRRDFNIALDYAQAKSRVNATDLKTSETKHTEFDIPPCVTDIVSGFFYVASLPLAPGFSQTFPVNDNGKTINARVEVESRETVKGPTGEFQTLRVKAEPISGPMEGKAVLWVWFTDDDRRMPVQMKSKLGFATLFFQLQKVDPQPSGK